MECQFLLQGDPKDQTQVSGISCMDKRYFTTSATWEAPQIGDPLASTMSVLAFRDGERQRWLHQGGLPGGGGLKGVRLGWRRRIREEGILGRHRA